MTTLGLDISPQQRELEKNCSPHLAELRAEAAELTQLMSAFRGTNDNRKAIAEVVARMLATTETLTDQTIENLALKAKEEQIESRRSYLRLVHRSIMTAIPHLYSEEEGSKPVRKKMGAKLGSVLEAINSPSLSRDVCEVAASETEKVIAFVEELLILDPRIDLWQPRMMMKNCQQLMKTLREPIPATAAVTPASDTRPLNHKRTAVLELVRVVASSLNGLGLTVHGGREHVLPIVEKVKSLEIDLFADLRAPIDPSDVRRRLTEVRADLQRLERIPSKLGDQVTFPFFREEAKYALVCVADALKGVPVDEPLVISTPATAGGFGWAS